MGFAELLVSFGIIGILLGAVISLVGFFVHDTQKITGSISK